MALQRQFVLPPPPNPDDDITGYSWRDWFRQLRDYIVNKGSILWSQIDFTGSKLSDIVNRPHNVLQAKQGGSTALDQFYHLTQFQHDDLTDGGETTLHTHKHNNTTDKQGGTTNEYYHLTSAEYTGTGTGVFVRQNGPSISGPTIDGANPYIQFNNGAAVTLAAGRMWYDGATGSLNFGMGGGNITQQVGEEIFIYGKASSAITEGQLIVKTGTVGSSGVITFAPSPTGLTINDGIIGVATENIAANAFGRITNFGVVRGINTTGSSVGETWADNDTLYYNPNYVGGLTKVKPSAPYAKFEIATVINAGSGGSGSLQINLVPGSTLGGTDSNVQFGTLNINDLIQYNGTYWTNVAASSISIGTATNADNVKTVSTATNANYYLTFVDSNNGTAAYEAVYTDAGITYNPSTNSITSGVSGGTF